jgi:glycosyltransferase involved in cell wall biosynthesis
MEGGGTERQLTYLVRELADQGCDVHVALNRGGPNLPALGMSNATIHLLGPLANHDPRLFLRLRRLVGAMTPDICQCWLLQMEVLGGISSMLHGVPWIFSERSSALAYPATLRNALRIRVASRADAIVSNSATGDGYWRSRVPDTLSRYVIPNGLPLVEIAAAPAATDAEAGVETGEPLVLWAGRLDAGKNAETLVRALGRLASKVRFRAILCGDGPERMPLQSLVAELRLAHRIRIAGYTPNLWSLMKRASLLVSVSRFEGSPNVVLEAMACGCPVIVSDIPAHRELLDEAAAIFTPPDEVAVVASRIESTLADGEAARRRADAARLRVVPFGAATVARQYIETYRDVLSRRRRPSTRNVALT